jgi:hypothetical protein
VSDEVPVGWRAAVDQLVAEFTKVERFSLEQVLADLVTAVDIANKHGFESQSIVWNYRVRYANSAHPFPAPVAKYGRVEVYWGPDVDLWMTGHKRRKQTLTKAERSLD